MKLYVCIRYLTHIKTENEEHISYKQIFWLIFLFSIYNLSSSWPLNFCWIFAFWIKFKKYKYTILKALWFNVNMANLQVICLCILKCSRSKQEWFKLCTNSSWWHLVKIKLTITYYQTVISISEYSKYNKNEMITIFKEAISLGLTFILPLHVTVMIYATVHKI